MSAVIMTRATGRSIAVHGAVAFAFGAMAMAGAVFALAGPVMFVRMLGMVALSAGALGAALQGYLLYRYHAVEWRALRMRVHAWHRRTATPHGRRGTQTFAQRPMAEPAVA